jgi:hypothetical protein
MSDDTENKVPQYELREDGEIHFNKKGKSTLLAKYDEDTGILTFESFQIDQKHRSQICRAITEDVMTGEQTGRRIATFRIVGRPKDTIKPNEPPQPKKDPSFGDKTPAFVKWLFKWRPQAAYVRYGVILDSNGDPQTAHCYRIEQGLLQAQKGTKATVITGDGKDALAVQVLEDENGILAMRSTCMTFTKKEVVGYSGGDDDSEDEPEPADDSEPSDDSTDAGEDDNDKPKRGRPGRKPKEKEESEPV